MDVNAKYLLLEIRKAGSGDRVAETWRRIADGTEMSLIDQEAILRIEAPEVSSRG